MTMPPEDRLLNNVPYPETRILTQSDVFHGSTGLPSYTRLYEHFQSQGRVDVQCALRIIEMAREVFQSEPNLVEVAAPATVVGDIHGQFYDLLTVLEKGGGPEETNYVFLGDYVDRGQFGCEVILLLFSLKLKYPNSVTLLRGNHESSSATKKYGFQRECEYKFPDSTFYDECMETFNALPLCALVDSRYLCMHGGLSPELHTLADIQRLNRFQDIPHHGLMCHLMWSDPSKTFNNVSKPEESFVKNKSRGCAYRFSYAACREFLFSNNLVSLIRAHECPETKTGIEVFRESSQTHFPLLITVFSAPNYCDTTKNEGSILKFHGNDQYEDVQYGWEKHPYILPNFENGFKFCELFLVHHVTNFLLSVFDLYSPEELAEEDGQEDRTGQELLNKKRLIELSDNGLKEMTEKTELLLKLKGLAADPEVLEKLLNDPRGQEWREKLAEGPIRGFEEANRFEEFLESESENEDEDEDEDEE